MRTRRKRWFFFFKDQKAFQCERGCYYVQRGADHSFQPDWLHVTVALYVVTEGREEYDKEDRRKMKGRRYAEEEEGEAERTNLPPPRWHRWIYAGRTVEAPRGLSGCNFSSAAASDHRLPENVLNKASDQLKKSIWSLKTSNHRIIVLFLDPKFRA